MINILTNSPDETKAVAKALGVAVRGGEVIELISDVGGGKTTFTKGLALGMGITETVQSPTFTISRLYNARDGLELHHFDFYRLTEAGVVAAELAESIAQPNAVVVVEWGEIVHNVLPAHRISIAFASPSETQRELRFDIPAERDYLLPVITSLKESRSLA